MAGWAMMLEAIPTDVAMRAAKAHYSSGDARTITPGDLLDTWAAERRREQSHADQVARGAEVQHELGGPDLAPLFGSGAQYLADMVTVVAQGGDPSTVARPAGVRVSQLSPEAEARERRGAFPDIRVCTHLECRDGWLDAEETIVNGHGQRYVAAVRCPQCLDGIKMAGEKGIARRPRKGATR